MNNRIFVNILIIFIFGNMYSQQNTIQISLPKYKIKNDFFKTNLQSILSLEEQYLNEEEMVLYNELHIIVIKRKKINKSFDITIAQGNREDILDDSITLSSIGFFNLCGKLFIVKGYFLIELFEKTKHKKNFIINKKNNTDMFPIIDDSFEWNYIFFNGYLFLERGTIGVPRYR